MTEGELLFFSNEHVLFSLSCSYASVYCADVCCPDHFFYYLKEPLRNLVSKTFSADEAMIHQKKSN